MRNKLILIAILILAALACGFAISKWHAHTIDIPVTSPASQAELAQLQSDLPPVAPHFIDSSRTNAQALTPEEQKIKDDVVALLAAGQPDGSDYYSGLWLDAVGKRYILLSQPSAESSLNELVDSQTGKVAIIPGGAYFLTPEGRDIALYIDTQSIRTYTLDQSDAVLVPGSQLSGTETYHSGTSDAYFIPEQTHTADSITISVFDSSHTVQNPDAQPNGMQTMNKKLREMTLSF